MEAPAGNELASAIDELLSPLVGAVAHAQPGWLLAALVLHSASLLVRVRIWQLLLRAALPDRRVRFADALGPYLAGVGANVIFPLRSGDAVRVAAARRSLPGVSSVSVVATLAAEAIPGLIAVPILIVAALSLGVMPIAPWVAGAAVVIGCVLAVAAWRGARALSHRRGRNGRLGRVLRDLDAGVRVVGRPAAFARTMGPLAVLDWTLRIATLATLLAAFRLAPDPVAAIAVVAVDSLTTLIPVLPNGAGAQQAGVVAVLHTHASANALVAFSAGSQIAVGIANVLAGLAALTLVGPRRRGRPALAAS